MKWYDHARAFHIWVKCQPSNITDRTSLLKRTLVNLEHIAHLALSSNRWRSVHMIYSNIIIRRASQVHMSLWIIDQSLNYWHMSSYYLVHTILFYYLGHNFFILLFSTQYSILLFNTQYFILLFSTQYFILLFITKWFYLNNFIGYHAVTWHSVKFDIVWLKLVLTWFHFRFRLM